MIFRNGVALRIKEINFVKSAYVMGKLEIWPEIVIRKKLTLKPASAPVLPDLLLEGSYLFSIGKIQ